MNAELQAYRDKLESSLPQIDDIFAGCMQEALAVMSDQGVDRYLESAGYLANMGRGTELVLIFLQTMPAIVACCGEEVLTSTPELCNTIARSGNAKAINPFLSTLPAVARSLKDRVLLRDYFIIVEHMSKSAGTGLVQFLEKMPQVIKLVTIDGVRNWVNHGLQCYKYQPHRLGDYFSLHASDSRAALQRERHGTLYMDSERRLGMYLKSFWDTEIDIESYSVAFNTSIRKPAPFIDKQGLHLPDVYDDLNGVRGVDRYRALLAHLMAHKYYTEPFIADNYSPFQQIAIECFEDSRVEYLAMQRIPGLRRLWKKLHPIPQEGACPDDHAPTRHLLAMISRAILDPDHDYKDPRTIEFADRFRSAMEKDPRNPKTSVELGIDFMSGIPTAIQRRPKVWFKDTEVSYRDDNRYIWIFLEDSDDEDEFTSDHAAANPRQREQQEGVLFSRHLDEWDYQTQAYRPDWATVYESIQESGQAGDIDKLLERHTLVAKKLKRIIDMLKPQQKVRVRYQEDGSELDLDIAIRAMVDYKSNINPDPRIHFSNKTDGRDIAVTLLLDLSESINEVPEGAEHSIKQLSQEAASLLAWAVDALGDDFSIAGFASNTRHEVRYFHFKGFSEAWGPEPKARLAAMDGGYSTRMGTAIRNAGHYLSKRNNDKKLLLVLTDGEPHDIDVQDPQYLRHDTKKAVEELAGQGVATYCITLDPNADEYVQAIFGNGYAVIDNVEKLPEKLPQLFMALTK